MLRRRHANKKGSKHCRKELWENNGRKLGRVLEMIVWKGDVGKCWIETMEMEDW